MTLDDRMKAAARALGAAISGQAWWWDDADLPSFDWSNAQVFRENDMKMARAVFESFGLTSSPPTHWLAPMEATDGMDDAAEDFTWRGREAYAAMRDAYLNQEGK